MNEDNAPPFYLPAMLNQAVPPAGVYGNLASEVLVNVQVSNYDSTNSASLQVWDRNGFAKTFPPVPPNGNSLIKKVRMKGYKITGNSTNLTVIFSWPEETNVSL